MFKVMKIFCALALAILASAQSIAARELRQFPELAAVFKAHAVAGTFVLLDPATDRLLVSNEARARTRYVPASTFKIPNSLIALDAGAVRSVDEVVPYGGKPQRLKQWEKDMNLRDAFKASSVPIFQELARRVGLERMRDAVRKLGYGNMEIGSVVDRFWLDGPLVISAVEQAEFLERLVAGKLPFNADAVRSVKEMGLVEKNESFALHAKTGWHWPGAGGQQIGWWVGWVERDGAVSPFALNIDINADADAAKRIPIARECLNILGKI